MDPIRIFVSYDGDHDADLHDRLHGESVQAGSEFELSGHSQGGAITESWLTRCRSRIRAADEVIVICGEHTDACKGVAAELRIAQEEKRPYILLWGRRECMCTKPSTARPTDGMYRWTRELLQTQILGIRRALRTSERLTALSRTRAAQKGQPHGPS